MPHSRTASLPYRLILVRPRFAGNLGACARVAANFGVSDVVLVDPLCAPSDDEAQKYATGIARTRLAEMRRADSVEAAIADCQAAIGFTRRHGELRAPSIALGEIASLRSTAARIALVFGNEETGLTADELRPCTHLCTLATTEEMPSMNLSHAVAVVLGRLYESATPESERLHGPSPQALGEMEAFFGHLREFLIDVGLRQAGNPDRLMNHLRPIFHRAIRNQRELRLLRGILSKAQVAIGTRRRGQRT